MLLFHATFISVFFFLIFIFYENSMNSELHNVNGPDINVIDPNYNRTLDPIIFSAFSLCNRLPYRSFLPRGRCGLGGSMLIFQECVCLNRKWWFRFVYHNLFQFKNEIKGYDLEYRIVHTRGRFRL